jgi:hypothetical protein
MFVYDERKKEVKQMLPSYILEEKTPYNKPDYNYLFKKLISEMFEEFILFFAPYLHEEIDFSKSPSFLQPELFQKLLFDGNSRNSTVHIIQVPLTTGKEKWILIHFEIQGKADEAFRKRMFRHFYRIYDRYNQEIYTLALLMNVKTTRRQHYFDYHFFGTSLIYHYNVYNFLEQNIAQLKQSTNPFSLVVLAVRYENQASNDAERYALKKELMIQVLKRFSPPRKKARHYLSTLFHFIDYIFQTPRTVQQKLKNDLINSIKEENIMKDREKSQMTSALADILEDLEKKRHRR